MATDPQIPDEAVRAYGHAYDTVFLRSAANDTADLARVEAAAIRDGLAAAWPILAEQIHRDAYWKLREHASAYRGADVFRRIRERWEESGRRDHQAGRQALVHEFFARGIEAAARDIAEWMGVPEHEIEEVSGG